MFKKVIIGVLLIINFKTLSIGSSTIIKQSQKELLNKHGYKIEVVDKIEDTNNWGFNPAGLFVKSDKTILLDSNAVDWAFNHEYGHFIDNINYNISTSRTFKDIYNNEKNKFDFINKEYANSSTTEYFACAYREYIEQPNKLKNMCIETYNFIDGLEIN